MNDTELARQKVDNREALKIGASFEFLPGNPWCRRSIESREAPWRVPSASEGAGSFSGAAVPIGNHMPVDDLIYLYGSC